MIEMINKSWLSICKFGINSLDASPICLISSFSIQTLIILSVIFRQQVKLYPFFSFPLKDIVSIYFSSWSLSQTTPIMILTEVVASLSNFLFTLKLIYNYQVPMNILQLSESDKPLTRNIIIALIQKALPFHLHQPHLLQKVKDFRVNYIYSAKLYLPKLRQSIEVLWSCIIMKSYIETEIQLNTDNQGLSLALSQLLKEREKQILQFVKFVNGYQLRGKDGTLFFFPRSGSLKIRLNIGRTMLISTISKLEKYLKAKIGSICKSYAMVLQNIVLYYRLFDFQDYQVTPSQFAKASELKNQISKILLMKTFYEYDRGQRPRSSRLGQLGINYQPQNDPRLAMVKSFLQGNESQINLRTHEIKFSATHMQQMKVKYEKQCNQLKQQLLQYQQDRLNPILTSIDVKEVLKEERSSTDGAFSHIYICNYSFIPQLSIYENTPNNPTTRNQNLNLKLNCLIIKKVSRNKSIKTEHALPALVNPEQEIHPAIQNQCDFLTYMRNKVCPKFAKYYCHKAIIPFFDGEIFLDYYPKSLKDEGIGEEKKLDIIEDVCLGLLFLSEEQVIHRDLKESNVMMDRNCRGRIIDFGSASNTFGSAKFKPKDTKLRSTPGYYLRYRDLPANLASKFTYQQFYSHRFFDLYSLSRILHNVFKLQSHADNDFIRTNLRFLSQRCMEVNPEDRWSHEQVLIYLRNLRDFMRVRREYWELGSQKMEEFETESYEASSASPSTNMEYM